MLAAGARQRLRPTRVHPREIMPLAILFQQAHSRTFKAFYTEHAQQHLRGEFPHLVSYTRFVELLPTVLVPLVVYLHTQRGACTGISFVDATALGVCENPRIGQHRVFARDAARGKTSVGWCYGFTRHLVVNDRGELLAFCLTPGNVDDRRPVPRLVRRLFGKLFWQTVWRPGLPLPGVGRSAARHSGSAPHHQAAQKHAQLPAGGRRQTALAQAGAQREHRG